MSSVLLERAEAVRRFNRSYTRRIGALREHLARAELSLTESRILYELGAGKELTSADLRAMLGLDAGYLSRIVSGFESKGLISRTRSTRDARAVVLELTDQGRAVLSDLEQGARDEVMELLREMPESGQEQLVQAMDRIRALLGDASPSYLLRDPRPGDMGLVVQQQAELYAREYGWNSEFEAMAAELAASYLRDFDHTGDRCWIAEKDGRVAGSVFVVRQDQTTAKLRMLYVDANVRGLGIGKRLVEEALHFARQAGYTRIVLWTTSVLTGARALYEKAGFSLVEEEQVQLFGKKLTGQTWARDL